MLRFLFMRGLILFVLALLLVRPVLAEDADHAFRSGLSAFNEGAYGRARSVWDPLAAAGDPRSETAIGFMYYSGRGVPLDRAQAAEFFARAADQGEPTAQLFLALMYFKSDGVPANPPLALMWVELAVAGGQPDGFLWRDAIMQGATAAQRDEGWRLLAQWREAHRKPATPGGPAPQ
jgi:uncharacterized protein